MNECPAYKLLKAEQIEIASKIDEDARAEAAADADYEIAMRPIFDRQKRYQTICNAIDALEGIRR